MFIISIAAPRNAKCNSRHRVAARVFVVATWQSLCGFCFIGYFEALESAKCKKYFKLAIF